MQLESDELRLIDKNNKNNRTMDMKTRNFFLTLLVALTGTAACPAQEGESTKEGVPVVEEIVTDSNVADDTIIGGGNIQKTTRLGSWSVTYTNDSISNEEAEELLEEFFDMHEGAMGMLGGLLGAGAAAGGLLIAGLVLLCIFGIPLLGIILVVWLVIRIFRRNTPATNATERTAADTDGQGRDRTIFNKGVKNVCLGVGLAIFLGIMMGNVGVGIGVLVACIGIGELLVDYFSKK